MKKILVVDDEEEAVDVLKDFLTDLDYSIQTALNGEEALNILTTNNIDILLLDLRMPRIDGEGILKVVREISPKTVVIITTGYSDGGRTKDRMMKYKVDYYLEKPLDLYEIEQIIATINKKQKESGLS